MPDAQCTWLLTELDRNDPDPAFGLCDPGFGFPEFCCISLTEPQSLRGKLSLPIERDLYFDADQRLSVYAEDAHWCRRIVA